MDYEKKYKEALERAKEINNEQRAQPFNIMTRVFPELAESEDEKIRKELLNYLYDVHDDDEDRARWLAWLEKQDEKGIVLRDTFGYEEGRQKGQEEGIMLVLDNPQKYGLEKQGEQKPAWSVEDNRIVAEIHHALEACEHEWNSDMSKEKDWLESLGNRVQPQQEWREKDKEILEDIIKYGIHHMSLDGRDIMWLESLKNKCIPQPKQEWSEVDERCRKTLLHLLEHYSILTSERESCIVWLKSLRPQPKQEWSDEDEATFTVIGSLILDNFSAEDASKTLTWLHSLTPHPQWKPSDEQMRVLDLAIRCGINRGTTEETTLVSLFNDLKKLKEE